MLDFHFREPTPMVVQKSSDLIEVQNNDVPEDSTDETLQQPTTAAASDQDNGQTRADANNPIEPRNAEAEADNNSMGPPQVPQNTTCLAFMERHSKCDRMQPCRACREAKCPTPCEYVEGARRPVSPAQAAKKRRREIRVTTRPENTTIVSTTSGPTTLTRGNSSSTEHSSSSGANAKPAISKSIDFTLDTLLIAGAFHPQIDSLIKALGTNWKRIRVSHDFYLTYALS